MESDLNTRRGRVLRVWTAGFVFFVNAIVLGALLGLFVFHMGDFGWVHLTRRYFQLGFVSAWAPIVMGLCFINAGLLLGSHDGPDHAQGDLQTASGFAAWIVVLDGIFIMVEMADHFVGRNVAPLFLLAFPGLHLYMIAELHLIRRRWSTTFERAGESHG
jgi:hypothetical protein